MFSLPKDVTIIEVGPRDGLQNEAKPVPTSAKLRFIDALQKAKIAEMELTSFVSPKWVPQLSDAEEVLSGVKKIGRQLVLTPNEKGVQRALDAGADAVAFFVGVSNTFNQKNINKSTAESMEDLQPLIRSLSDQGVFVRACISTAFYCPFEGTVPMEDTLALCDQFVRFGADELSVADTIGLANPQESYELFSNLKARFPDVLLTAHFHDTRRMALANIFAALQAGIDRFDTSAGGLGGCPFAPGSTGNVATEDVVHMLHRMGIRTGVDEEKLCEAIRIVETHSTKPITTGLYTLYKNKIGKNLKSSK